MQPNHFKVVIFLLINSLTFSFGSNQNLCFPADTCHSIGVDLYKKGKYFESIKHSKEAAQLRLKEDQSLLWKSYRNMGLAYYKLFDYKEANFYFKKAYETKGEKEAKHLVQLLRNIGECLLEIGDQDGAVAYSTKAIQLIADDNSISIAYAILAKVMSESKDNSDINRALNYANEAIKLSNINFQYSTLIKGNSFNKLGQFDKALRNYEDILNEISEFDIEYKSTILNNIAIVYRKKKEYKKAISRLQTSLNVLKNYDAKFHYSYAMPHENLADNYTALQQFDTALLHYQKALINLTNNFRTEDIYQNPNPKDTTLFIYSNPDMIRVLHLKATAAYQYYQQNQEEKYLTLANQTYQTAFDFHDQLQKEISTENSRLFQVKNIVPYIENALKVAFELQEEGYDVGEAAFRFMEKNKATVLLQSMNEADALQFANLPDSLMDKEKELKIAIAFYTKQLNEAIDYEDSKEKERLDSLLFEERQNYSQLINNLEENYPDYYNLKYQQNTDRLTDIQNQLNHQTALLEYFVGDSSIFILSIQKDTSILYQFQKPVDWDLVVDDFLATLHVHAIHQCYTDEYDPFLFNDFRLTSTQLFDSLLSTPLQDLGDQITHLQIIPDAKLNYVPFELLLTNNNFPKQQVDYKNLPYLLKEKTISYAYSAALLLESKNKVKQSYQYQYAGFAPSYDNNKDYFTLHATKGNVTNLSKNKGMAFVGHQATENNFKDAIHLCQMFQFAGHGDIDDNNPLNSKLVFTKINDSTDYELHAYELYNLKIPAQLGMLSACETGLGKTAKGEGIMSLSRAFTYAGCHSLVMSLWSIYDKQTADMVERFFSYLKKGKAKSEALRCAKLDFLHEANSIYTHPVYWAGLVQIGDTNPLTFNNNFCYSCLFIIIVFLLTTVIWYFSKGKTYNKGIE